MDITIVGLGAQGRGQITLEALEAMRGAVTAFRTARHDAYEWLLENGVEGFSLDKLYEQSADFTELCEAVSGAVIEAAKEFGSVVYAVPGCPGLGDATVAAVLGAAQRSGIAVRVLPGVGYAQSAAVAAGGLDSAVFCPALALTPDHINTRVPLVVTELDNRILAGECKLLLLEYYPYDWPVLLCEESGSQKIPLGELDWHEKFSHFSAIVLFPVDILSLSRYDFNRLLEIAGILRGKGGFPGCPWDVEQTHESLRQDVIEEAYEVVDAIDSGDADRLADELGDLLLQVALHAQIAKETDEFDAMDVATHICQKMILRHPHVFGQVQVSSSDDVLTNWDAIKKEEKQLDSVADAMRDVPRGFPGLLRAAKVLKKARDTGFAYTDVNGAIEKLLEEIAEVRTEIASGNRAGLRSELGDMLFAAAEVVRMLGEKGELLLGQATDKFIARFARMEELAGQKGTTLGELPFDSQVRLWERAKKATP